MPKQNGAGADAPLPKRAVLFCAPLGGFTLLLDLATPRGVAAGTLHATVVLGSLWARRPTPTRGMAVLSTGLIGLAFLLEKERKLPR